MNIGTHFDYNTFICTHTKRDIPHEKALITVKMKVNLLIRLFERSGSLSPICLSPIVSKLSTRDTNLGKARTYPGISLTSHGFVGSKHFTLVGGV